MSPKGQVVIPKPLRDRFGIKEGDEVLVEETSKGVLLMKRDQDPLVTMVGLFEGKTRTTTTTKRIKSSTDLVRALRSESEARLKQAKSNHPRTQVIRQVTK